MSQVIDPVFYERLSRIEREARLRKKPRSHQEGGGLIDSHLLGAPASVGLAHVGGRLDGRDELEDDVDDTDQADDRAGDDAQDAVVEQDGADEDVDYFGVLAYA